MEPDIGHLKARLLTSTVLGCNEFALVVQHLGLGLEMVRTSSAARQRFHRGLLQTWRLRGGCEKTLDEFMSPCRAWSFSSTRFQRRVERAISCASVALL